MTRESVEAKGRRYLIEGRVVVEQAGPGFVLATVRGDGELHVTGYQRGFWHCTCPCRTRCSHLIAVGLVSAPATVRVGDRTARGHTRPSLHDAALGAHPSSEESA